MAALPDYRKAIETDLNEFSAIVRRYTGPESPLPSEKVVSFSTAMAEIEKHCQHTFGTGKPRIMLYGTYNSGKSTLLNALMGEEKARMGDVPTTAAAEIFSWNGYELIDTPGINAPIEHEEVTRKSLAECQVILFVVSSGGSHDDARIYHAMKEVIGMGKKLFVVVNDKESYGLDSPEIRSIVDAVQKNLETVGVDRKLAASFSFNVVNAVDALDGRQNDDQGLVECSGIVELERRMLQEIQRVKGFDIMADLCGYLQRKIQPFADALTSIGSVSENERMDNYYAILEGRGQFCASLEDKLDDRCATLPNAIKDCFGHPIGQRQQGEIEQAIRQVYEKYNRDLAGIYESQLGIYLDGLARQIHQLIAISSIPGTEGSIDGDRYRAMTDRHNEAMASIRPEPVTEPAPAGDTDILDILTASIPILTKLPGPKLPVPLPGPLPPILVPVVFRIAKKLYEALFGESEEEKENRMLEQRVRAERDAAEARAREIARWEEEVKQHCDDLAMGFRSDAKRNFRQHFVSLVDPAFKQVYDGIQKRSETNEQVLSDLNKIGQIMSSLEILRADLQATAI